MKAFNEYQMAAKKTYAEGEFSDVRTLAGTKKVGDPLFAFVMADLGGSPPLALQGSLGTERIRGDLCVGGGGEALTHCKRLHMTLG